MFGHGPANIAIIEPEPEEREFIVSLVRVLRPLYAIETGCYHGTTSAAIGRVLGAGHLHTMDTDVYSVDMARFVCTGLPVTVHRINSLDFVPEQKIDFAFLDSDIGDQRSQELVHFGLFRSPRAIFAMHDSLHLPWPDTTGWHWVDLPTPRGLLLLQAD